MVSTLDAALDETGAGAKSAEAVPYGDFRSSGFVSAGNRCGYVESSIGGNVIGSAGQDGAGPGGGFRGNHSMGMRTGTFDFQDAARHPRGRQPAGIGGRIFFGVRPQPVAGLDQFQLRVTERIVPEELGRSMPRSFARFSGRDSKVWADVRSAE